MFENKVVAIISYIDCCYGFEQLNVVLFFRGAATQKIRVKYTHKEFCAIFAQFIVCESQTLCLDTISKKNIIIFPLICESN